MSPTQDLVMDVSTEYNSAIVPICTIGRFCANGIVTSRLCDF